MYYQPTKIDWGHYHFLIMSAPDQKSMKTCIKDLQKNDVKLMIKSCETTYSHDKFEKADIKVQELLFSDGQLPPKELIDKWLKIVDDFFDS